MVIGIQEAVEEKMQPMMKTIKEVPPRLEPKMIMKHLFAHLTAMQPITPVRSVRIAQITRIAEPAYFIISPGLTDLTSPLMMAVEFIKNTTDPKIITPATKSRTDSMQRMPRFFF